MNSVVVKSIAAYNRRVNKIAAMARLIMFPHIPSMQSKAHLEDLLSDADIERKSAQQYLHNRYRIAPVNLRQAIRLT